MNLFKKCLVAALVLTCAPGVARASSGTGNFSFLSFALTPDASMPSKDTDIYGLRLAVFSARHPTMYGCAMAVFMNDDSSGSVAGLQVAGMMNTVSDALPGVWQFAGIGNDIRLSGNGVQFAGVANEVRGDFCGLQIGAFNTTKGTMVGGQIGFYNSAGTLHGFQLGMINEVKSSGVGTVPLFRFGW